MPTNTVQKFAGVEPTTVSAVTAPATDRDFLIVGEDDTVTSDEVVEVANANPDAMAAVEQLAAFMQEAPPEVQQALIQIAQWAEADQGEEEEMTPEENVAPAQVASAEPKKSILAGAYPVREIKRDWFNDPKLSGPSALTVTEEGRVFGHIALWGSCHTGIQSECVMPPKSGSGYQFFRTGLVDVDGERIPVGQITVNTGHANMKADANTAAAHYDNTGSAAADVVAGEDAFGVWVAGAVRPGASVEQVYALRASSPSGDWRNIAGRLELIGVLAVNVPGYPVPRSLAASAFEHNDDGELITVIATGNQGIDPATAEYIGEIVTRLEGVESIMRMMRPHFADIIRAKAKLPPKAKKDPEKEATEEVPEEEEDKDKKKPPFLKREDEEEVEKKESVEVSA